MNFFQRANFVSIGKTFLWKGLKPLICRQTLLYGFARRLAGICLT